MDREHTTAPEGWEERGSRLASRSIAGGDPTGWFDQLYAEGAAGDVAMPWDRTSPHPLLVEWAAARGLAGASAGAGAGADAGERRAVVVGAGLGADAEYVAGLGYDTTGFDVAETAVQLARQRHHGTNVRYVTADLLDFPAEWMRGFDLVVDVITVQALPDPPRRSAIVNVGRLVAAGGTLIAIAARHDPAGADDGPPWPLTRDEVDAFATDGLTPVRIEEITSSGPIGGGRRWRAEFHRPD